MKEGYLPYRVDLYIPVAKVKPVVELLEDYVVNQFHVFVLYALTKGFKIDEIALATNLSRGAVTQAIDSLKDQSFILDRDGAIELSENARLILETKKCINWINGEGISFLFNMFNGSFVEGRATSEAPTDGFVLRPKYNPTDLPEYISRNSYGMIFGSHLNSYSDDEKREIYRRMVIKDIKHENCYLVKTLNRLPTLVHREAQDNGDMAFEGKIRHLAFVNPKENKNYLFHVYIDLFSGAKSRFFKEDKEERKISAFKLPCRVNVDVQSEKNVLIRKVGLSPDNVEWILAIDETLTYVVNSKLEDLI